MTGQDGSYLAELLLSKGYKVYGIKRRASLFNTKRIDHLYQDPHNAGANLIFYYGDLTDATNLTRVIQEVQPDEIYNLAAQSHVKVAFDTPEYTANVNALGTLRLLEAIRILNLEKKTRFYQASTSEMFGNARESPQGENTPFRPCSPYAVAKLYAYWTTVNYREAYGMFACNGILFNHESPKRGETFVTHKITRAAVRILLGLQDKLYLGNLNARRDWGHAKDYVRAMWYMLQAEKPDDYVIATGISHSVREFCEIAFACIGVKLRWESEGLEEKGIIEEVDSVNFSKPVSMIGNLKKDQVLIEVDKCYFRPTDVNDLLGNSSKALRRLGWTSEATFKGMISEMVAYDLEEVLKAITCFKGGFSSPPSCEADM